MVSSINLSLTSHLNGFYMKIYHYYHKSKLIRWAIRAYIRLFKLSGHPREIAAGFAVGIFVGMTPLLGGQMAIAAFFASLFRWNPISAAMGVWITNPLTVPFVYSLTYVVGMKVLRNFTTFYLPTRLRLRDWANLLQTSPKIILALFVGGILLGIPLAILSYHLVYWAIIEYRKVLKGKIAVRVAKLRERHRRRHDDDEQQDAATTREETRDNSPHL
ncbi:hypothetical protein U14_02316 [Candidatus Moduliflexus flocculans]|uniref:DUF2062 domain-containing protein n=1 Tax=Candidatus Moduliflexus flocculans TaxID=1499966 RepID=A0A0S6VUB8_9BACT|nr:hypothetical protein U14_02316 [Candidatus Moduliflexus flocculans]